MKSPLDETEWAKITSLAKNLIRTHSYASMKPAMTKYSTVEQWSDESFELVKSFLYKNLKQFDPLPSTYLKEGAEMVQKRLVLAGYRLADLVIEIYKNYKASMLESGRDPSQVNW